MWVFCMYRYCMLMGLFVSGLGWSGAERRPSFCFRDVTLACACKDGSHSEAPSFDGLYSQWTNQPINEIISREWIQCLY